MRQSIRELTAGIAQLQSDLDGLFEADLDAHSAQIACRIKKALLTLEADACELKAAAGI